MENNDSEPLTPQDTPKALIASRLEGESYEEYRRRRKADQELVDEYLQGVYIDKQEPSDRLVRRLKQGKRTYSGLSKQERDYLFLVVCKGSEDKFEELHKEIFESAIQIRNEESQ